jgi:DnaA family protein
MKQLPLGVRWPDHSAFANFFTGPNRLVVEQLRTLSTGTGPMTVWIWGPPASGKTHLLQAVCAAAGIAARRAAYFPLALRAQFAPAALTDCEQLDVVCIDDADSAAGDGDWERALFNLYNGMLEHRHHLLLAARSPPAAVPWSLPDLGSRWSAALVLQVRVLDEVEQVAALKLHAGARGLELPDDTAGYLMKRFPRDLGTLCALLDTLDTAALAAQRRLTVPFIRQVIDEKVSTG